MHSNQEAYTGLNKFNFILKSWYKVLLQSCSVHLTRPEIWQTESGFFCYFNFHSRSWYRRWRRGTNLLYERGLMFWFLCLGVWSMLGASPHRCDHNIKAVTLRGSCAGFRVGVLCVMANTWILGLNYTGTWQCPVFKQNGEKGNKGWWEGKPSVHSAACICRAECIKGITILKQDLVLLGKKCRSQCLNLSFFPEFCQTGTVYCIFSQEQWPWLCWKTL